MSDAIVRCLVCRQMFIFSVEDQILAIKTIPLDDLLDAPGEERSRYILPPSECLNCRMRLAERW